MDLLGRDAIILLSYIKRCFQPHLFKMKYKKSFLKSYVDLPLDLRRELLVVIDDSPITWNVARIEIENETKLGKRILEKLVNMGIING